MTPIRKRLFTLAAVVGAIGLLRSFWGSAYDEFFNSRFNSQFIHLRQVEEHIEAIRPSWHAFTNENQVFGSVYLFPYTGGDGMFGAYGTLESEEQLKQLRIFMEETSPPRPVYLDAVRISPTDELN